MREGENSLRYEGVVRKMLKEIKYRGSYDMVKELVDLWERKTRYTIGVAPNTLVTAVPMWGPKKKKRGFNQAELIARELAKRWDLEYRELLIRTRETQPMYGLDREQRRINIHNAFAIITNNQIPITKLKSVILVDDVWTTGSTIEECEKLLINSGIEKVIKTVIAR